ncbi:ATP-binding cassette domain-containing protein [Lactobacillus xylocopicola]|uniref:ABC transmembrane type-1 domain-containing protein n=1 Tax=Lactobacillus xylocopicola TaxID=2976676 RepID=A0ABM8BI70_9LACO|nr:ATP-binding cassette domain-containing protein [Lactobacillus xylocopicola]BDR60991.1 hypothetical protein KIM322_12520 [Lactobacillus xylocopicola]
MSIKDYYKQSPLRFILMIVNDILIYALLIVSTAVVMMEMTAIQQCNWRDFLLLTLACFGLILADYLLQGFNDYLVGKQNELYYVTLRQKITWHLYRDQLSHPVAQVQNRLTNDLVQNMENYLEAFMEIIGGVTVLVAVIILLLALHWSLLLTIMAMVAVSLLLPKLLEKPMQKATLRISESNRKYLDSLGKWISGLAELRRYLAGEKLFSVTSKAGRKLEDSNVRQTAVMQELTVINGFVSTVFSTILLILAGYLIQQKLVVFGVIVAVDNCSLYLTMGIQLMVGAYGRIKGTKKLNQEIAASALPIVEVKGQNTGTPAAISTHNLSLQFPNGESLHFPDIDVQAGEKILLTGDSGAGKSTLLKLILGQIDASSGTVAFKDDQGNVVKPDMSRVGLYTAGTSPLPGQHYGQCDYVYG